MRSRVLGLFCAAPTDADRPLLDAGTDFQILTSRSGFGKIRALTSPPFAPPSLSLPARHRLRLVVDAVLVHASRSPFSPTPRADPLAPSSFLFFPARSPSRSDLAPRPPRLDHRPLQRVHRPRVHGPVQGGQRGQVAPARRLLEPGRVRPLPLPLSSSPALYLSRSTSRALPLSPSPALPLAQCAPHEDARALTRSPRRFPLSPSPSLSPAFRRLTSFEAMASEWSLG